MGKIDTSGWKEYRMSDLGFTVCHGSRITKAERGEGDTVFLTAGFENCGVVGTIGNENIDVWEKPITVDMFGNVFYHDETCAGDDNIYAFLNSKLSRTAKLFVASSIASVTQSKYSYQQQFRQGDANKLSVYLPTTPNGDPDWAYMESYMANLETKVAESLTMLQAAKDAEKKKVDTREWGEFRVGELFEVKISKSVDKGGLEFAEDGEYDFIGRTPLNNGIQGRLNKLKFEANQEGTYSIAQIGMHVCQYRERKWYASQNIFILTPFAEKSHKANKCFLRPSRHVGKRTVSVLRKSSGTMVASPSLTRMVCRLNPATNILMTNISPYRFSSVRAIFCFQKKFSENLA